MNHESSPTWSQTLHDDTMVANPGDDEFSNFLDLGIDFPNFDGLEDGQSGLDTPMGDLGMDQLGMDGSRADATTSDLQTGSMVSQGVSMAHHGHMKNAVGMNPMLREHQMNQRPRNAMSNQNCQPQIMIPLTPHSSEMQGAAARYQSHMDLQGHIVYDQTPMSFTPLVSPAVTPLDSTFHMPDFAVPGEYFSPLTSPALEGQNTHYRQAGYPPSMTSDRRTTGSPIDHNVDVSVLSTPPAPPARKSRRKPSTSNRASSRSVRQSPIVKPNSRRKQSNSIVGSSGVGEAAESLATMVQGHKPEVSTNKPFGSSDGSAPDSVSPEALSDALMPPPALPRSSGKSPNIPAQSRTPTGMRNGPATPATLMRLETNQGLLPTVPVRNNSTFVAENAAHMDDITLKEAVNVSRPLPSPIDTSKANSDDHSTPPFSVKTPKLTAGSTPRNMTMSPQTMSPTASAAHKQPDTSLGLRSNKKRQSTSSAQISPSLRPKISPSIKPLVPASGTGIPNLTAETSALYLASKSNYHAILEGTHLPGILYPEDLAENLTSKRTSHKIAEQGRRNRINVALKTIEGLLPSSPNPNGKKDTASGNDGDDLEKSGAANQGNSKASTVESAISYIKALQAELDDTKAKLEAAEKKLAESSGANSQTSE